MGTVSKALSLLTLFSRTKDRIGLSEIARLSGMNKATAHRLLSELQISGFVEQVGSGREYRLGPAYLRLAALREATVPMRDLAYDVVETLAQDTGETAHVSLLHETTLSTITYAYAHQHGLQVTMEDAEVLPLHATSSGHAVLAFSEPGFVADVLAQPLEAQTDKTITDPETLKARLLEIRASGLAECIGAFEAEVHTHAAPLFDSRQACIGAIAVAAPSARMTDTHRTRVRTALLKAAPHLTRLMGGFLPDTVQKDAAE